MDKETAVAVTTDRALTKIDERNRGIYSYLDELEGSDRVNAQLIADDLLAEGEPLASTLAIIPVAAHQEAAHIRHAVSEYARQDSNSFSVVLGLNSPTSARGCPQIEATLAAIEDAKSAHPHLDLRATNVYHYDEPVIGKIRRDLWNGVALASRETGNFELPPEVIGVNHDIDLVELSPVFFRRVQHYYRELDKDPYSFPGPVATHVRHAPSPDHPNISAAVQWIDFVYHAAGAGYEAGTVIPMSAYAREGGFDRDAKTSEVSKFIGKRVLGRIILDDTETLTSIRRYVARMGRDGYRIWSDETFSAEDECRERQDYPDISRNRQIAIVATNLQTHAKMVIYGAVDKAALEYWVLEESLSMQDIDFPFDEYVQEKIGEAVRLARFTLAQSLDCGKLNRHLKKLTSPRSIDRTVQKLTQKYMQMFDFGLGADERT